MSKHWESVLSSLLIPYTFTVVPWTINYISQWHQNHGTFGSCTHCFKSHTDFLLESMCKSCTLATWCKELIHWKRPRCWQDGEQEEKEVTEDKMVEWHLWLNGHEFGQTPGDSEGLAKTGVLQSMESRTVGPGLATE